VQLPETLRCYADFLDQYLDSETDCIAISKRLARSEADEALLVFSRILKDGTGKDMYRELALLLSGTAEELGLHQQQDSEYTPEALKTRLWRLNRKRTTSRNNSAK
jgi:hypothetical protein